ncbi:hypothetical protein [Streptomyces sp. NPDC007905]|uniref:hypothetical protein n=1 Tax=Streptomyces sp. NPDC007905 TaxID=3364788 RepID=UPI0036E99DEB
MVYPGTGAPGETIFDTHISGGVKGAGGIGAGTPRASGEGEGEGGGGKRGGGGRLGGKLLGGAGVLGDLLFIWEGAKTLERGCDDVVVQCGPPPTA